MCVFMVRDDTLVPNHERFYCNSMYDSCIVPVSLVDPIQYFYWVVVIIYGNLSCKRNNPFASLKKVHIMFQKIFLL